MQYFSLSNAYFTKAGSSDMANFNLSWTSSSQCHLSILLLKHNDVLTHFVQMHSLHFLLIYFLVFLFVFAVSLTSLDHPGLKLTETHMFTTLEC